jgi:hypothetical protein
MALTDWTPYNVLPDYLRTVSEQHKKVYQISLIQ